MMHGLQKRYNRLNAVSVNPMTPKLRAQSISIVQ